MRIKIQRTRFCRVLRPNKPLTICLGGSRRHRAVQVHRSDSSVRKIQHEVRQGLSVCSGLIQTNIPYLA